MTQIPSITDIQQLLETIRVEASADMAYAYDLDEHLDRLLTSITALSFALPTQINDRETFILFFRNQCKNKVQYYFKKSIGFAGSMLNAQSSKNITIQHRASNVELHKLCIIYSRDASFSIEIEPYSRDLNKNWQVKILNPQEFHIKSNDPIWKYKFYPRVQLNAESSTLNALKNIEHSALSIEHYDEVIWTNEHGHLCEGSFTNIFFYDTQGQLCTPSLDCNILPGIMRSKIIETCDVTEGHYLPQDLKNGFFLVNSMFVKEINPSSSQL